MDLKDKFEINHDFLSIKNNLFYIDNNEKVDKLNAKANSIEIMKESSFLSDVKSEYDFFKSLHVQGKYDNIISLIKIGNRLNIDLNFEINIEDPDYDLMWDKINEQIPIPNKLIEFLEEYDSIYINDILDVYNDELRQLFEKYTFGDNNENN